MSEVILPTYAVVLLTVCCVLSVVNLVGIIIVYLQMHGSSAPVVNGRMSRFEAQQQKLEARMGALESEVRTTMRDQVESTAALLQEMSLIRARFEQLECVAPPKEERDRIAARRRKDSEDMDSLDKNGRLP